MKNVRLEGRSYILRIVKESDALRIIELRSNPDLNKYLNEINLNVVKQREWIRNSQSKDDEYYFAIEDKFTGYIEGFISIYNILDKTAEWGRWIIEKNSLSAIESAFLIHQFAFNTLNLEKIYSITVADNLKVIEFHKKFGANNVGMIYSAFEINGISYNANKFEVRSVDFELNISNNILVIIEKIYFKRLEIFFNDMTFDHIGYSSKNIKDEEASLELLGYKFGSPFVDQLQGVSGVFATSKNKPTIEILENLPPSNILDSFISRGIKMYHIGFITSDIRLKTKKLIDLGAKQISDFKLSAYYESDIVFLVLPNSLIIELIERSKDRLYE